MENDRVLLPVYHHYKHDIDTDSSISSRKPHSFPCRNLAQPEDFPGDKNMRIRPILPSLGTRRLPSRTSNFSQFSHYFIRIVSLHFAAVIRLRPALRFYCPGIHMSLGGLDTSHESLG